MLSSSIIWSKYDEVLGYGTNMLTIIRIWNKYAEEYLDMEKKMLKRIRIWKKYVENY